MNMVYVGGDFLTVCDVTHNRLAVDVSTDALLEGGKTPLHQVGLAVVVQTNAAPPDILFFTTSRDAAPRRSQKVPQR